MNSNIISPRLWEPKFIEKSKVPVFLSRFAPIDIGAISLIFCVFSKGKMSKTTRRHETIHFQQWIELGIVGFAILYPIFYLMGLIRTFDRTLAYLENPFEIEAYQNERKYTYLRKRKRYAWASLIF